MKLKQSTVEMLQAVARSKNESCASVAKRVLEDPSQFDKEMAFAGSFMRAVLSGDYVTAMNRADVFNRRCLESLSHMPACEVNSTAENNKLIAEFMGAKVMKFQGGTIGHSYWHTPLEGVRTFPNGAANYFNYEKEGYHKSWDWLMPVVQKIAKECVDTEYGDLPEIFLQIRDAVMWDRVNECQAAVVEFIKWYNENK